MRLDDLHVVVTGGAGALGRAVVHRLVELGACCHVPVRRAGSSDTFPSAVRITPDVDLADDASVRDYYAAIPWLWASIHCAGGFAMAPIQETSGTLLEEQLRLNFITCYLCCREAVAGIRRGPSRNGGRIVNVTARPALEMRSGSRMTAYASAKAAVAALTVGLGEEVVAEGILVNAVVPSILDTPANRKAMPGADFSAWAKLDAVAETMVFLASPANRTTRSALVPVYGTA